MKSVANPLDLTGRVAIVTGGAGRVGSQLCQSLGEANATVVIAARNTESTGSLAEALMSQGLDASCVALDVTNEDSVIHAQDWVLSKFGRVDILVNNAGAATNRMIEDLTVEEWNRVMAVNATGTFICCKVFSVPMIKQAAGSIINVASIYGVVAADQRIYGDTGRNSSLVYAASKAAIIQMTRYLAVSWADKGIRVNCISPGGVENDQEPEFTRSYGERVPMGRMVRREELGSSVVFLASDAASYITGHNLVIDGGWTAW